MSYNHKTVDYLAPYKTKTEVTTFLDNYFASYVPSGSKLYRVNWENIRITGAGDPLLLDTAETQNQEGTSSATNCGFSTIFLSTLRQYYEKVYVNVSENGADLATMLNDTSKRNAFITYIINHCNNYGFDGVNLNFEPMVKSNISGTTTTNLLTFCNDLATQLASNNLDKLSVSTHIMWDVPNDNQDQWDTVDYNGIAATSNIDFSIQDLVDNGVYYFEPQWYDQFYDYSSTFNQVYTKQAQECIDHYLQYITRDQLIPVIGAYGSKVTKGGYGLGTPTPNNNLTNAQIQAIDANAFTNATRDTTSPYLRLDVDGGANEILFADSETINQMRQLIDNNNLAHAGFWLLGDHPRSNTQQEKNLSMPTLNYAVTNGINNIQNANTAPSFPTTTTPHLWTVESFYGDLANYPIRTSYFGRTLMARDFDYSGNPKDHGSGVPAYPDFGSINGIHRIAQTVTGWKINELAYTVQNNQKALFNADVNNININITGAITIREGLEQGVFHQDYRLGVDGSTTMDLHFIEGSPYIDFNCNNIQFEITTIHAMLGLNAVTTDGSDTADKFVLELNSGQKWILYFDSSVTMNLVNSGANDTCTLQAPYTGYLRIVCMKNDSYETVFDNHRNNVVTRGNVDWSVANDEVTTTITWDTTQGNALMACMPHHREILQSPTYTVVDIDSIHGGLKTISGNTWTMVDSLPTRKWLPYNKFDTSRTTDISNQWDTDVANFTWVKDDIYFGGKELAKYGNLIELGDELGKDTTAMLATLKDKIEEWLNGENGKELVYEPMYGMIVTERGLNDLGQDFGQATGSDHHFHYGYLCYAASIIIKRDTNWGNTYDDKFRTLIRDFANPNPQDEYFPFLRHAQMWWGSSWTNAAIFNDGNDQESSSEAVNAYHGLYLYGLATDDQDLQEWGQILLANELLGKRVYYDILQSETKYPDPFGTNPNVGIRWSSKNDWGTWFSGLNECITGIQMLPFTAASDLALKTQHMQETWLNVNSLAYTRTNVANVLAVNPGSGYTNGIYNNSATTDTTGSGSGAIFNIVVEENEARGWYLQLENSGSGYEDGAVLTAPSLPGGSGASVTISPKPTDGWSSIIQLGRSVYDPANTWNDFVAISNPDDGLTKAWGMFFIATREDTRGSHESYSEAGGSTPAVSASNSILTASPTTVQGNNSYTITLQVKDQNNNNWTTGGDTVVITVSSGTRGTITDNNDGTYTATGTAPASGTVSITGTINGSSVQGTSINVESNNSGGGGSDDFGGTVVDVYHTSVPTNGSTYIIAQLKNGDGNNVTTSNTVQINSSAGVLGASENLGNGFYRRKITVGSSVQTITATISIGSSVVGNSKTINVVNAGSDLTDTRQIIMSNKEGKIDTKYLHVKKTVSILHDAPLLATDGDLIYVENSLLDGDNTQGWAKYNETDKVFMPLGGDSVSAGVSSVNNRTGNVTLTTDSVSEGNNKYISQTQKTKLINLPAILVAAEEYVVQKNGNNWQAVNKNSHNLFIENTNPSTVLSAIINNATSNNGANIQIEYAGKIAMTEPLVFTGNDQPFDKKAAKLSGRGSNTTLLEFPTDTNGVIYNENAMVHLYDFGVVSQGTGTGLITNKSTTTKRGTANVEWHNLYFEGFNHTGWMMELDNHFRSIVGNIEGFYVANGIKLLASDTSNAPENGGIPFNPGDSTWNRVFIELNAENNGKALSVESNSGQVNQVDFMRFEAYNGGGAGNTGIYLGGSAGSNHIHIHSSNLEQFDTLIDFDRGFSNTVSVDYCIVKNGGTFFKFGANANGNTVRHVGFLQVLDGETVTFIDDDSTWDQNYNTVQDAYLAVATNGTLNNAPSTGTKMRDIKGYNDGTMDASIVFGENYS